MAYELLAAIVDDPLVKLNIYEDSLLHVLKLAVSWYDPTVTAGSAFNIVASGTLRIVTVCVIESTHVFALVTTSLTGKAWVPMPTASRY